LKTRISIIGCGWLGLPFAKHLRKSGYDIKGSTTTKDKIKTLRSNTIEGFLIVLTPEGIQGDIASCLKDCETLLLNIPPGLRKHPETNYVKQMQRIIPFIEKSSVKQVLFVSSTSVYDDDISFSRITENSPTSTTSTIATQLLEVEALFQKNKNFRTTIVRFSGLFGDERHPAKYLSGKKNVKNPEAPVNLIHQNDCILILESIIKQDVWNVIFNASTPPHPTKKAYYSSICKAMNLPLPEFDTTTKSKGKIIDSSKLIQLLDYLFKVKL